MKLAGFGRIHRIRQQQRRNPGVFELPFEKFPYASVQGGEYGNALQAASYVGQENVELLISKGNELVGAWANSAPTECRQRQLGSAGEVIGGLEAPQTQICILHSHYRI